MPEGLYVSMWYNILQYAQASLNWKSDEEGLKSKNVAVLVNFTGSYWSLK